MFRQVEYLFTMQRLASCASTVYRGKHPQVP